MLSLEGRCFGSIAVTPGPIHEVCHTNERCLSYRYRRNVYVTQIGGVSGFLPTTERQTVVRATNAHRKRFPYLSEHHVQKHHDNGLLTHCNSTACPVAQTLDPYRKTHFAIVLRTYHSIFSRVLSLSIALHPLRKEQKTTKKENLPSGGHRATPRSSHR